MPGLILVFSNSGVYVPMATSIFILLVRCLVRWSRREISSLPRPAKVLGSGQKKNKIHPCPPVKNHKMQEFGWCPSHNRQKKRQFWGCCDPTGHGSLCHSLKHTKKPKKQMRTDNLCWKKSHFPFCIIFTRSGLGYGFMGWVGTQGTQESEEKYPRFSME